MGTVVGLSGRRCFRRSPPGLTSAVGLWGRRCFCRSPPGLTSAVGLWGRRSFLPVSAGAYFCGGPGSALLSLACLLSRGTLSPSVSPPAKGGNPPLESHYLPAFGGSFYFFFFNRDLPVIRPLQQPPPGSCLQRTVPKRYVRTSYH